MKFIKKVNIKELIKKILLKNRKYKLSEKSALISYYILLSIGPFLIIAFSFLSNLLKENVDSVVNFLSRYYEDITIIINPILNYIENMNMGAFAIIGTIGTLYSSSIATRRLVKCFDEIFELEHRMDIRNSVKFILQSMLFTLALIASLVIFFIFYVHGNPITNIVKSLFEIDLTKFFIWNFLTTFLPLIYMMIFVTIMFRTFPNFSEEEKISRLDAIIGAGFVTIGWSIGSKLFYFYITNISTNNIMYGALGSIMIIVIWFRFLIYVLLTGASLIKSFSEIEN